MSVTLAYLVQAISKTLNPEWNQNFILTLKGLKDDLNISVFDKDTFSKVKSFFLFNESDSLSQDDPMGNANVPLEGLKLGEETTMWVPLKDVTSGEIQIKLVLQKQKEIDED